VPRKKGNRYFRCLCECGREKDVNYSNLKRGITKSCGCKKENQYRLLKDGKTMVGTMSGEVEFLFDIEDFHIVKTRTWYPNKKAASSRAIYVSDCKGEDLHKLLLKPSAGFEVDHIDLNPLNNCRSNLRICTHQQNQCNQAEQVNNTSGVAGVSYYPPRKKYRARIKASQHEIHLGYFYTFQEAVQARNEGVKLMFGEYGILNDVPEAPEWIKKSVYEKCSRHFDKAVTAIDENENSNVA
jgi:hypothetical protein